MILKIGALYNILRKYKAMFMQQEVGYIVFSIRLCKLFVQIIVIGHFFAIIWLGIGNYLESQN
jgi:hypothetical protein